MKLKRIIKNVISDSIFFWEQRLPLDDIIKHKGRILMYHAVEDVSREKDKVCLAVPPEVFRMHMRFLRDNGFTVIDLLKMTSLMSDNQHLPDKAVAITFDDGFRSVMSSALPILREFNFHATLFVNAYFIGKKLPKNLYWSNWDTLAWDEVGKSHDAGLSIGSHAFTHKRLTELDREKVSSEIVDSKRLIERHVGTTIQAFCYPHGAFNGMVKSAVKNSGFRCACCGLEGTNSLSSDLYELRRTEITAFDNTQLNFKKKLYGCCDWLGYLGVHK